MVLLSLSRKVSLVILFHGSFCYTGDQAYFRGGCHITCNFFDILSFTVPSVEKLFVY